MKAGITSLLSRSSPARGLDRIGHRPALRVHSFGSPNTLIFDSMLGKAHKDYEAKKPAPSSQAQKPFVSSLQSNPGTQHADIRQQFVKPGMASLSARMTKPSTNPLQSRPSLMNQTTVSRTIANTNGALVSLLGKDTFKQEPGLVNLAGSGGQSKAHAAVYISENDFSDDDDLDLNFETPAALPSLPKPPAPRPTPIEDMPPPTSTASEAIPWTSSPPSHFLPPGRRTASDTTISTQSSVKRETIGTQESMNMVAPKKAKKRVLPASFKKEETDEDMGIFESLKTPANKKRRDFWDPSASAMKEQKKQFRNQRNPDQAPEEPELQMAAAEMQEMATSHGNSKPMTLSAEQKKVLDLVVNKGQSVFFTGAAGTGKSVLMRAIIADLKKKFAKDPERVAVTASTGLAACNIGGITLHSFSGIGLGKEDAPTLVRKIRRNAKAKNRWLRTKILILDEVSMVDGDLFDKLSQIGRTMRNNGRPWGGIQLVITGDFFQLPPVPDHSAKRETKFAFDAATWNTSIDHTIGLTQVFRQRDSKFANMLNEMRLGKITEDTVRTFKSLARPLTDGDGLGAAELFSTRAEVESSNERRLRELPGKPRRYEASDTGVPEIRDKLLANMMSPKTIDLKLNAQVMLIKNMDDSLVNGSLGKVVGFSDENTFDITMDDFDEEDPMAKARRKLKGFSRDPEEGSSNIKYPVVQFRATDGIARTILCVPEEWKVELPNGEVQAKRTQLPLILAWALSIHKAQGQTLERVKVNLGRVFEKGQAYVALSRATTQEGLQVLGFEKTKVMAHPRVIQFYNKLYSVDDVKGMQPQSISDFVTNRLGPAAPRKVAVKKEISDLKREVMEVKREVVNMDDDEEALSAYY